MSHVSATIRERTSGDRFVSCVNVVSKCRGKRAARAAFAAWNSSTSSPNRAGFPPTSFSAASRK